VSLGPPFDESGLRRQQAVGAFLTVALAAAVGWVLTGSGRTLGRGVSFEVELSRPGLLRSGGKVRLAGQEVGEVRQMRQAARGVTLDVFVARQFAAAVRDNSELFVATPSILGEAYLEIGPPRAGLPPGPPIVEGAHLGGVDPPDIDNFLAHTEGNLRVILGLLRDQRPEIDELLTAGDSFLSTLTGLPADAGQLARIGAQAAQALESGRALLAALRQADAVSHVRQIAADLRTVTDEAAPELRALSRRIDAASARLGNLQALFEPARAAQLASALASLRRAAVLGQTMAESVSRLAADVERGRGTIGAFLADRELFDDLHETHRILKSQPWTLILKPEQRPQKPPSRPR
jgi:ABC-type transporter Mla subunit MlaD